MESETNKPPAEAAADAATVGEVDASTAAPAAGEAAAPNGEQRETANAGRPGRAANTPPVRNTAAAPPKRETPAGTPPAARVAPGAAKASSTPTAPAAKGLPKPAAARQSPTTVVESVPDPPINKQRRRIVWAAIAGFFGAISLATLRFFLPRAVMEPSSVFRIGFPGDYALGVDTKYQQQRRIWVVKNPDRLFVIYARCTHLGCTPDWKESETKFKCPCHGSGYDSEGVNFEGPAPRPMDRAEVKLDAEGQIVVNTNKLYLWEKGKASQFDEEGAYIPV